MDKSNGEWKDRLGIAASALCAVHCAATPVLLVFLPTLQFTEWMASPLFHQIAAAVCVALVGVSIIPAYRKHNDVRVLSFSGAGLAMILAAAFLLPDYCCEGGHHHHAQTSQPASQLHLVSSQSPATPSCSHENCNHSHAVKVVKVAEAPVSSCSHAGCTHSHGKLVAASNPSGCESDSADCCSSAAVHDHPASSSLMVAGISGDFWAVVQPWMTPIGGLLLMVAHGLNMRRSWGSCSSKKCGCGLNDSDDIVVQSV